MLVIFRGIILLMYCRSDRVRNVVSLVNNFYDSYKLAVLGGFVI